MNKQHPRSQNKDTAIPKETVDKWQRSLNDYLDFITTFKGQPSHTLPHINNLYHVMLEIFNYCILKAGIKDEWRDLINVFPFGITAVKKSKRLLTEFEFGFDNEAYYIEANLDYSYYLRHMTDEFWQQMLKLTTTGNMSFIPIECPAVKKGDRQNELLFKSNVSTIYILIRNYVILTQQGSPHKPVQTVGKIRISWPIKPTVSDIVPSVIEAIELLYGLNYQLYRPYYQSMHTNLKKLFSELSADERASYGDFRTFFQHMMEGRVGTDIQYISLR